MNAKDYAKLSLENGLQSLILEQMPEIETYQPRVRVAIDDYQQAIVTLKLTAKDQTQHAMQVTIGRQFVTAIRDKEVNHSLIKRVENSFGYKQMQDAQAYFRELAYIKDLEQLALILYSVARHLTSHTRAYMLKLEGK